MSKRACSAFAAGCLLVCAAGAGHAETSAPAAETPSGTPVPGLSLFGLPKYKPGFTHFDWVNPDAPKGGTMKLAESGSFDTLNPFPPGHDNVDGTSYVNATLMAHSLDEPFARYGLIADSVTIAPDHGSVTYHLKPEAVFSDGSPVRPEDVVWSYQTLTRPEIRYFHELYANVVKSEKVGDHLVKFTFRDGSDRQLPLILGDLPVLSEAYWAGRDFDKTTFDPPVGSGPYKITAVDPGRSITYERIPNWWGAELPAAKGLFNVDRIQYDYYRDDDVALEAFKAGAYDVQIERSAKRWQNGYEGPALAAGRIVKKIFPDSLPRSMAGMVFNTRRAMFADRRVRQALGYALDFEWTNKTLMFGAYSRAHSFWNNSELGSSGLPSGAELALLETYRGRIPDTVFTTEYRPPETDGSGELRDNLKQAQILLEQAGWSVKGKQLVNDKTGQPFAFEILEDDPGKERYFMPVVRNLQKLGIEARLTKLDSAQYTRRFESFDFDMLSVAWPDWASPGNEQRSFWGSASADRLGGFNIAGVKDPVVDDLIDRLTAVTDYDGLKTVTRALDRVLLNGYYMIPEWYVPGTRVAYWDKFKYPSTGPAYDKFGASILSYGNALDSWWVISGKTEAAKAELEPPHAPEPAKP